MSTRYSSQVRRARAEDAAAIRDVIVSAFADEGRVTADLWEGLAERPGGVSYVAERDGSPVGHVHLTWCWLDAPDRLVDVLVLSPLSVVPDAQRRGVGRDLVAQAIAAADEIGAPLLFLEGDPAYYSKVGFAPGGPLGFTPPSVRIPPPAFQVAVLSSYDASMTGALVYADAFWMHDGVGLRGEDLAAWLGPAQG